MTERAEHTAGRTAPMSDKTGGPAFPDAIAVSPAGDVYPGVSGMTLRDYFAAAALTGLVASPRLPGQQPVGERFVTATLYADLSYAIADAMIAARATGGA